MPNRALAALWWAATVLTYGLVILGGFVTSTGSGFGCGPDWPVCGGHLLPPANIHADIEWSHRLVAAILTLLPLALEYIYWNERLPEILANWGKPVQFADATTDTAAIQAKIVASLAAAKDELALLSSARDPQTFDTLLSGKSGLGSIYGLRMRLRRSTPRDSVSGVRSR